MGGSRICPLPAAACFVLATDPARQAGNGALRPRRRHPDARGADGRRPSGDGRGGMRARRAIRHLRGRCDERALRGHLPGAGLRPGPVRQHRPAGVGPRLPVGEQTRRRIRRLARELPRGVGRSVEHRHVGALGRPRRALPALVGEVPTAERQPERRDRHLQDEHGHRRSGDPAHGARPGPRPAPVRRPGAGGGSRALPRGAYPGGEVRRAQG